MIYGPDKVLLLQLLPTAYLLTYLSNASSFTLFSSTNNFRFVIADKLRREKQTAIH